MQQPVEKRLLLQRLGFEDLTPASVHDDLGQIMAKADDYVVSIASLLGGWISLWGQYDFNILHDVSAAPLLPRLSDATPLIYYAVEGTSGGLIYERYDGGQLTHSYLEIEGRLETERCVGTPPPKSEKYGQVDDWSLLEFALPAPVTYEQITETKHEHYRFRPAPEFAPREPEVIPSTPWWKMW